MDIFAPESPTFTVVLQLFDGNGDVTGLPDSATVDWTSTKPAIVAIERADRIKALLRRGNAGLAVVKARIVLANTTIINAEDLNVTVKADRQPVSSKIVLT